MLGQDIYHGTDNDPTSVLVEMLHSCTPSANKEKNILSFQSMAGTILLLIATVAFGMGVDCKGVHRIIHYGPAKNVEAYIQETGRAGRDGIQSDVYILYHGILLSHVDGHMTQYVKTHEYRRKELLKHLNSTTWQLEVPHLCCDNCVAECKSCQKRLYKSLDDSDVSLEGVATKEQKVEEYHAFSTSIALHPCQCQLPLQRLPRKIQKLVTSRRALITKMRIPMPQYWLSLQAGKHISPRRKLIFSPRAPPEALPLNCLNWCFIAKRQREEALRVKQRHFASKTQTEWQQ